MGALDQYQADVRANAAVEERRRQEQLARERELINRYYTDSVPPLRGWDVGGWDTDKWAA